MRRFALTVLFVLLAAAVTANAAEKPADRPFIESTYVIAPDIVGAFRLVETHYDPAQRFSGAKFRYAPAPEPNMTVDVFVYAVGRGPQEATVSRGMAAFRQDLENAKSGGLYRVMDIGPDESFPLDLTPVRPAAADNPLDARIAKAMAENAIVGKRIRINTVMGKSGLALQSRGYLFYRQLNFFKVRVSVPKGQMSDAELDRFADHAARSLVPVIEALNIGGCASKSVEVNPKANPEDAVMQLLAGAHRIEAENCAASPEEGKLAEKSRNAKTERIVFEPGDWKSTP